MAIVAIPRFVEFELDGGEIGIGVAIAAFAIAAIAVRPFVGRLSDRYGRRALMTLGALIAAGAGCWPASRQTSQCSWPSE